MADLYVWLTRQINHPVATDCCVRCAHCYWCQTLATILSLRYHTLATVDLIATCYTLATFCLIATVQYFGHCRSHRYGTILWPLSVSSLRYHTLATFCLIATMPYLGHFLSHRYGARLWPLCSLQSLLQAGLSCLSRSASHHFITAVTTEPVAISFGT